MSVCDGGRDQPADDERSARRPGPTTMYQPSDSERSELWTLSRDATVFFSLSACALAFAFGLWLEPSPAVGPDATGFAREQLLKVGVPFLTLVSMLLACVGYMTLRRRRRAVEAIAERTRAIEAELIQGDGTTAPTLSAAAREPARSLLRW